MGRRNNKKETILRVAEGVFSEKNFAGATMREIAEGADLLKPGLYHYFRSKEDIYKTLILDIYEQLRTKVIEPVAMTPDPREKLRMLAVLLIDFWAEHPRFPRIIAQEVIWGSDLVLSELVPKLLIPMFRTVVGALNSGEMERHGLRDVDLPLLVFNIFGMSIFYFFSGPIFSTLTNRDSLSAEAIAKFKVEMTEMVFKGLERGRNA